jgi:deoxyadenosine/deoxycytidine kinase
VSERAGRLVAIIGNSGVGKTTLARALCAAGGFICLLEEHDERPFQPRFADDRTGYAFPNQVDYLLRRAEQEQAIRQRGAVGVIDGGLEQDFYIFTRLFYQKGYLEQDEFELCQRLYRFYRKLLPPPELTVWLQAPPEVIAKRFALRKRPLSIAQADDLAQIEALFSDWMASNLPQPLLTLDAATQDVSYQAAVELIMRSYKDLKL